MTHPNETLAHTPRTTSAPAELPTLAALMPVRNRPTVVLEALDSIAAQGVPPHQLIIADDGSDDATPAALVGWIARSPIADRARMIRLEHGGAPAAINAAADAADAQLLAILDSDDLWPADYVQSMSAAFIGRDNLVAATCDKTVISYPAESVAHADFSTIPHRATAWLVEHGSAGPSNTVFSAAAFHEIGGFDPTIRTGYDLNMMLRLSLRGEWAHVPGPRVTYRDEYARVKGEAPALSHSFSDRRLRRARNLERFIFEQGGADAVDEQVWRPRLARLWFKAGKQLASAGRRADARDCYRRAAELRPPYWRARLHLLLGR